jgi:ABC-2 type transport system ATP-binding protein
VLLDEPTNGLDPVQRDQMLALIRRVGHDLGLDVILSSHLLDEVERVSDSVVIIDGGRTVRSGRLDELRGVDRAELLVELAGADPSGDGAALVAALAERGAAGVVDGALVVVALEGEVVYDVVRDVIADLGLSVRRLQRRTASLEDVFLASGDGARTPTGEPVP